MHAIQALKSALDRAMWSRVLVGAEGEVSRSEGGGVEMAGLVEGGLRLQQKGRLKEALALFQQV